MYQRALISFLSLFLQIKYRSFYQLSTQQINMQTRYLMRIISLFHGLRNYGSNLRGNFCFCFFFLMRLWQSQTVLEMSCTHLLLLLKALSKRLFVTTLLIGFLSVQFPFLFNHTFSKQSVCAMAYCVLLNMDVVPGLLKFYICGTPALENLRGFLILA